MAHFDIISSQGQHPVIWSGAPKYVGAYLKPGYLEFPAIGSPTAIPWHVGDYVVYSRTGKTYRLYRTPQAVEQGLSNNYGASFLYENVQFFDDSKQLEFCPFTDLVPGDNTVHFSTQNVVSFFGKPLNVAERLQACLEAQYGAGAWAVRIVTTTDPDLLALLDTEAEFSVTGVNCLQALDKVYELWNNLGWIHSVENGVNVITIGASNVRTSANTTAPFSFGNGLVRVERSIANADQIGTRIFAYGSMKNMDATYYRGLDIYHAESVDIEHLMIPIANWGTTGGKPDARKAFIQNAVAIASLGLIPRTAYFDGTGDLPDIHPTIERMTIGEVYDAGGAGYIPDLSKWSRSQRIDEIVSATNPTDHGTASDMGQKYEEIISSTLASVSVLKPEGQFEQTIWSGYTTKSGRMTITFGRNPQTFTMMSGWTNPVFSNLHLVIYANGKSASIPLTPTQYSTTEWRVVLPESVTFENTQAGTVLVSIFGYVFRSEGDTSAQRTFTFATDPSTAIGIGVEYSIERTFTARIPQIGFDIDDYADLGNGKTVSMKTGMCAGRDFEVKDAAYDSATDSWVLTLYRAIDEDLNIMFPNADYEIEAGDQFVLLDIAMPEMYVAVASARLLSAAQKLLADISVERPFYAPQIDAKVVYNENRTLREGMWMDVTQDGNREYVLIDSITIDENGANIPTYEVALRENKGIEWTENVGKSSSSRSSVSAKGGEAETGGGSVKSVGLMVPTGMEVEGSPITGSGVMKIKMAQGYKIPQESELAQYFELDDTLVRLKGQYDYLGPRKGLIFEENAEADPNVDLEKVALPGGGYALHSSLPIYTDMWWSGRGVSPNSGGGGGGIDPTQMWSLLAAPTTEKINPTHIDFPVTSVAGQVGAITAGQIASALNLGAAAQYDIGSVASGNNGLVTGGAVWAALDALPEPMVFKGSLGTGGTITSLPAASSANEGFTYKVITAGTYQGIPAKVGDTFISNGTAWVLIPSGDEPDGTVTSVGLSMPAGFSVSSSPITTAGTLSVSFASGYSLLTSAQAAKIEHGETAYNWFEEVTENGVKYLKLKTATGGIQGFATDGFFSGRGVSPGSGGGGGGIDPVAMWSLLGAPTSEQINSTHISFPVTSVAGYTGAVSAAQIAAALGLSGMAYKPANQQTIIDALGYTPANVTALSGYLPLSGGTMTGSITNDTTMVWETSDESQYLAQSVSSGYVHLRARTNLYLESPTLYRRVHSGDSIIDYTIYDSGNLTKSILTGLLDSNGGYYLPLTGGTMNGPIYNSGTFIWRTSANADQYLAQDATNGYVFLRAENYIYLETQRLYRRANTSGGFFDYTVWDSSNFTPSDYLPLTGGTLQNTNRAILSLDQTGTNPDGPFLGFRINGMSIGEVGVADGQVYLWNNTWRNGLYLTGAGALNLGSNVVYHAGNSNKSDVPWACSTLTASSTISGADITVNGVLTLTSSSLNATQGICFWHSSSSLRNVGIFFASTSTGGTHGAVTGDVAMYHVVDSVQTRGWIFQYNNGYGNYTNVASISCGGTLTLNGNVESSGVIHASTGIWTDGYFSGRGLAQTSDERDKGGWLDITFTLADIVNAPAGSFAWLNAPGRSAGTTAQYWQKFTPELVGTKPDGKLSLEYGPLAFLIAHKTAEELLKTNTKVDKQGEELRRVKEELGAAKIEINNLRARLGIAS